MLSNLLRKLKILKLDYRHREAVYTVTRIQQCILQVNLYKMQPQMIRSSEQLHWISELKNQLVQRGLNSLPSQSPSMSRQIYINTRNLEAWYMLIIKMQLSLYWMAEVNTLSSTHATTAKLLTSEILMEASSHLITWRWRLPEETLLQMIFQRFL